MFAHLIYFLIYQFLKVVPLRLGCLYYVQFQQRQIISIPLVKFTEPIDIVFTIDWTICKELIVYGVLWVFTRSAELHGDWNWFSIISDSVYYADHIFSKVFFLCVSSWQFFSTTSCRSVCICMSEWMKWMKSYFFQHKQYIYNLLIFFVLFFGL